MSHAWVNIALFYLDEPFIRNAADLIMREEYEAAWNIAHFFSMTDNGYNRVRGTYVEYMTSLCAPIKDVEKRYGSSLAVENANWLCEKSAVIVLNNHLIPSHHREHKFLFLFNGFLNEPTRLQGHAYVRNLKAFYEYKLHSGTKGV